MDAEQINILLAKHFAGETSREEELLLNNWIIENRKEYLELKILWADTHESAPTQLFAVDKAWDNVERKLNAPKNLVRASGYRKKLIYWFAAASVLLVAGTGFFFYINGSVTESALAGQIKRVLLDDGSVVTLKGQSEITYARRFSANRKIALKGEAYFEVKHDNEHAFSVKSGRLLVNVLGTSFLVKNEEKMQQVIVNSGKVAVKDVHNAKMVVLTNNQAVIDNEGTLTKQLSANRNELAWQTGQLTFKDTPLNEVFIALESQYGVSIVTDNNNMATCLLTTAFNKQSLKNVLNELSRIFGFTYQLNGKKVTITGIVCNKNG